MRRNCRRRGRKQERMRTFTAEELSEFDGRDGRPAYIAYNGRVYDVSEGPTWVEGMHLGHSAGEDLTEDLEEAPHEEETLEGFPIVGEFTG